MRWCFHVCGCVCVNRVHLGQLNVTIQSFKKVRGDYTQLEESGTVRDQHINRFEGFGFECIFTHTPLHKSQLGLQNSTELKRA